MIEKDIKEEIYEYVSKFNLSDDEMKVIDSYVLQLLENFQTLINTHNDILSDKEKISMLKSAILESIGS